MVSSLYICNLLYLTWDSQRNLMPACYYFRVVAEFREQILEQGVQLLSKLVQVNPVNACEAHFDPDMGEIEFRSHSCDADIWCKM